MMISNIETQMSQKVLILNDKGVTDGLGLRIN